MFRGGSLLPARQPEQKVVQCLVLSFLGRPELEEAFQLEHGSRRAPYDAIRALLRLAAWLGFVARAAARAGAWRPGGNGDGGSGSSSGSSAAVPTAMLLAAVMYSLAPVALMHSSYSKYLRWRCWVITAWNLGHAVMVVAFYTQLYPAFGVGPSPAVLAASPLALPTLAGWLMWLLWHSQALIMALNAGYPLVNTFRHFLVGQLAILWIHLHLNPHHCATNPQLQAAVAVLHTRIVCPLLSLLLPLARSPSTPPPHPHPLSPAVATHMCGSFYLPTLQLVLGVLLPCALVYRHERQERRRFLSSRGLRPEMMVRLLGGDIGLALIAAALQLGALVSFDGA